MILREEDDGGRVATVPNIMIMMMMIIVPATKESVGLFRSAGKRPDGATQIPLARGKLLALDATVPGHLSHPYATATIN